VTNKKLIIETLKWALFVHNVLLGLLLVYEYTKKLQGEVREMWTADIRMNKLNISDVGKCSGLRGGAD
jgi:hypothetical protein